MIRFNDFFKDVDAEKTKIKFNKNPNNSEIRAIDLLRDNDDEWYKMNAWRKKKSSNDLDKAEYLIALAQYPDYGAQFFIFGGLYKVEMIFPKIDDGVGYKLTLLEYFSEYIERLIIKIQRPIGKRETYNRLFKTIQESLNPEIYELLPYKKIEEFKGFQNVSLNHQQLNLIAKNEDITWKNALSNVKAIYVITDTSNGKLYVGSASGDNNGLWQRWSAYANLKNPTGDNKDFKHLVDQYTEEYIIKYFKYSIIEIFDSKTSQDIIYEREQYWMKVFETKKFGMNY